MLTKQKLRDILPVCDYRNTLVVRGQNDKDIIKEILKTHAEHQQDYDLIYSQFDTGDIYTTCKKLFDFLKHNLRYQAETEADQTVKSPGRILSPNEKIDCKHFSLFIGGVLDAIKRNRKVNWSWCYRFASYTNDPVAAHVFVVVTDKEGEIWVDPVLTYFDERKEPTYEIDKKPMALYKLSGINDKPETATVKKDQAEIAFLIMVNMNLFSLKELLLSNSNVTFGPLKRYFETNGFDFQNLLNMLNG